MKIKTLAVLAGVGAPLILSGSVSGEFVGITTTSKPNPFGLLVVNVYANFDSPGEDHMVGVAGTPLSPLHIWVEGGVFYNHPFGSDLAPPGGFLEIFPSLAFDTFVTIGKKTSAGDATLISPGFPELTGPSLWTVSAGWVVTPNNPQGNPFDAVNSFPGNGQVLIGQFSTADGTGIGGTMLLKIGPGGTQAYVSFFLPSPGTLAMMGMTGVAGLFGTRRRRPHRRGR